MFKNIFFVLVFALALGGVVSRAKRSKLQAYQPKHNGTKHAVQYVDIGDNRGQVALSSLANEFVHSLHESIYLVNQAIQNAQDYKDYQNSLVEISNDATDLAFAIQKEIHGDARQLQYQIKSSIIFLSLLLPEITDLVQNHENATFSNSLVREAIDSSLFAVQKLEVRTEFNSKTNKELLDYLQKALANVQEVLNKIKPENSQATDELQLQVHHLNHILDKTVNKLEVWLHANIEENNNAKIVEEVAQNFGTLSADLRKDADTTLTVTQLKDKIKLTLNGCIEQLNKLSQVELSTGQANQEQAAEIFRNILFDGVAIAKTFSIQLELISQIN